MNQTNSYSQNNETGTPISKTHSLASQYMPEYEYRSQTEFYGVPLIHIATGIDPATGRFRVARGVIALGDIAIGGLAVGGISCGVFSLGGVSAGLFTLGGISLGGFAVGGIAIGALAAIGGIAVSMKLALGVMTITPKLFSFTEPFLENIRTLAKGLRPPVV